MFVKILCIILMNLNHSVNIVIYSVTAKEFRSEMAHFLQAVLYCIIGKPMSSSDMAYLQDDRSLLSRLRHLRQNVFKCCRMKLRSNSTNTTDSSGFQHTTAAGAVLHGKRLSNSNPITHRKRLDRNGHRKNSNIRTSETSVHKNNHRLTVQLQADPASSIYEREDISFRGLSISTDD